MEVGLVSARSCKDMGFVDATVELQEVDDQNVAFQQLERLFLSTSPIRETERKPTTLYLARILPMDASLVHDEQLVSECDFTPPAVEPIRLDIWKRISEDLDLILRARRDWERG